MAFELNWLSLLISIVGSFTIGYLWFGPLFGDVFVKGLGYKSVKEAVAKFKKMPNNNRNMAISYITQIIASILLACFISLLVNIGIALFYLFIIVFMFAEYANSRWRMDKLPLAAVNISGAVIAHIYYVIVYYLVGPQMVLFLN